MGVCGRPDLLPSIVMRSRVLACLALWPLAGCNCDDETLGRVAPVMVLSDAPLDFGQVPLGATRRLSATITNRGEADLEISAVDAPAPFGVVAPQGLVPPSGQVEVEVWFRPTNDEPQTGVLTVMGNDPITPMATLSLSGLGIEGVLSVVPAEVDFEGTKVGNTRSIEIVLENRGLDVVTGTVAPTGFVQPEHFTLTGVPSFTETAPFGIQGRTQSVLDFEYRPLDMGRHDGRIVFEICGARCGLEVEVRASAAVSVVRLEPAVLDFGDVGIGETRTLQTRLQNDGDEPVEVLSVEIDGPPDLTLALARELPATVGPSDGFGINVELTPSAAGRIEGELVVRTGPVQEELRAAIAANGVGPLFQVEPTSLAFGVERVPARYRRVVLLLNAGSSDVVVTGAALVGDSVFSLDGGVGLPARLGSGESLTVPVAFQPANIGEYRATLNVTSDDANQGLVEIPVTGALTDRYCELSVAPSRISFGLLPPGYIRRQAATVENVGTDPCNIVSAGFRAPGDPAITEVAQPWPATLQPGDTRVVDFEYAPVDQRRTKVTYAMQTDDPVFPERTVGIFGTSEGNLEVFTQPGAVDFGSMHVNCGRIARNVSLINAGTIDVDISSVALSTPSTEISLANVPATPFRLAAGGIVNFEVSYQAADLGTDVSDVRISVSSFGFDITVPLEGEGATNPRVIDRHEQARKSEVDVLFVIDDSCSMGDDQQALAMNFRSFIQQADVRQVDFQLGVTTTTLFGRAGQLEGPILTRNSPNLESQFQAQASVGVTGSGIEQGLEAALQVYQAGERGGREQAKLLRPDAVRALIVVSDEDDQSPLAVATYFNELRQRAPNGYVTAMVSGQRQGCQGATGSAFPAQRYVDFATLTNGIDASICSSWANTLANIGQAAFGLRQRFFLSRIADTSAAIEVRIDGVPQMMGWTYDPADNSVFFNQAPPEGSRIEIEFTPVC